MTATTIALAFGMLFELGIALLLNTYVQSFGRELKIERDKAAEVRLRARALTKNVYGLRDVKMSYSFTGTVPARAWEVDHNNRIDRAIGSARELEVSLGDAKPPTIIPDSAFRPIGQWLSGEGQS